MTEETTSSAPCESRTTSPATPLVSLCPAPTGRSARSARPPSRYRFASRSNQDADSPDHARQPLPPTPSPKRRGGAEGEQPDRAPFPRNGKAAVFLPLSASGRGLGGGVLDAHGRASSVWTFWRLPRVEKVRRVC